MSNLKLELIQSSDNFQILNIICEGNGIISPIELQNLKLPLDINPLKGIILYGKGPIWLHSYLVHELHHTLWIATFDPRQGAIIVQSHSPDGPAIGDIIKSEKILPLIKKHESIKFEKKQGHDIKKIAFLGPPHSGKSVFMKVLADSILNSNDNLINNDDFYIVRACPDGEGNWFSDLSEELGKIFRIKGTFDDEFPMTIAEHLKEIGKNKKITFVDCGGIIDKKNQIILNECTHAIIVSSDPSKVEEWIGASKSSENKVIVIIDSVLTKTCEIMEQNILRFKFGPLERSNTDFPLIPKELLKLILE